MEYVNKLERVFEGAKFSVSYQGNNYTYLTLQYKTSEDSFFFYNKYGIFVLSAGDGSVETLARKNIKDISLVSTKQPIVVVGGVAIDLRSICSISCIRHESYFSLFTITTTTALTIVVDSRGKDYDFFENTRIGLIKLLRVWNKER